jgi:hypothetical protein
VPILVNVVSARLRRICTSIFSKAAAALGAVCGGHEPVHGESVSRQLGEEQAEEYLKMLRAGVEPVAAAQEEPVRLQK